MMTFLAFVVGLAIVGQTVYAATMEHLREYATLKALGATDSEVRTILWTQAAASAMLGFVLGVIGVWWVAGGLERLGLPVVIPPWLYAGVFCVGFVLCLAASAISVRKALEAVGLFRRARRQERPGRDGPAGPEGEGDGSRGRGCHARQQDRPVHGPHRHHGRRQAVDGFGGLTSKTTGWRER